jgi:hypothetical protein
MQAPCRDFLLGQGGLLKPTKKKLDAAIAVCPVHGTREGKGG